MISTGSKSVDAMLGGGICTQSITEVFGEYRTGKVSSLHPMGTRREADIRPNFVILSAYLLRCLKIKVEQVGKLLISILSKLAVPVFKLMDRGTFRPDRVKSVADRYGVDGNMALENVLCARAWSSEQQCELLLELAVK
jgi:meiotic recombination protein DMC1